MINRNESKLIAQERRNQRKLYSSGLRVVAKTSKPRTRGGVAKPESASPDLNALG